MKIIENEQPEVYLYRRWASIDMLGEHNHDHHNERLEGPGSDSLLGLF